MNYLDLYSSYPDRTITTAWNSQVKEADENPWLNEALRRCGDDLFARFASCYADLHALPRGARRALQRRIARSAILPRYFRQGGRRLQHKLAWSLAGAALLLALGQGLATAATITVTTNNPNVAADGQCSLIEAIINANNDAATHADCPAGSGADTIVLPTSANLTLSAVDNTTFGPAGLPVITSRITIEGNGATIARPVHAPGFSLMVVTGSGDLTLHHLTLSGSNFYAGLRNYGTASIKDSVISGNSESGVFNRGTLTIENSSISANAGSFYYYRAGGVTNAGTLTIENSTIAGNESRYGGGVVNYETLTIVNSTISGNTGFFSGGGVENFGTLTIENSTISGNTSFQSSGGGVRNYGSVTFTHTLIAGNQAAASPEIQNDGRNCSVIPCRVIANNFNLFGTNGNARVSGFTPGPTDIVPAPGVQLPQILGPLNDNGGPTETQALVAGSPAIDAGNPGGCRDNLGVLLLTDQRGLARHVDGNNDGTVRCDIGAFEYGAEFVPIPPPPPPPLAVGVTTVATGEAGVSFTSDLMISGGIPPYIVSLIKGALPAGLSLGNDGIISGTISPTAKNAKITVRITDSLNESLTQTFTITILKTLHVSEKARTGRVGKDYAASFKIRGGLGPFSWSITSGALPTGLSFNSATGTITGIPTQAGTFPLTVQVTDALGGVDAENLTLTIN
jgi:hypothetical protein